MRRPGRDRGAAAFVTGSHADSVPRGGNYDGLAGIVAGLVVARRLHDEARETLRDYVGAGAAGRGKRVVRQALPRFRGAARPADRSRPRAQAPRHRLSARVLHARGRRRAGAARPGPPAGRSRAHRRLRRAAHRAGTDARRGRGRPSASSPGSAATSAISRSAAWARPGTRAPSRSGCATIRSSPRRTSFRGSRKPGRSGSATVTTSCSPPASCRRTRRPTRSR